MGAVTILLIFVIVLALAVLAWYIGTMNRIKVLRVAIDEAKADIEVYMVKRYDVIMNSLRIANKYVEHESAIFGSLIKLRTGATLDQIQKEEIKQDRALTDIRAVAEAYPDLKSNAIFKQLQVQISDENEHFAASKRMYNSNVSQYNKAIVEFPASIVARRMSCITEPYYKDNDADKKKNADVSFD